jgi:membrane protein DedA with SNARE-associated domain
MVAGGMASFMGGIISFWLGRRFGDSGLHKIYWLHLTPKRVKWADQFFKRHGAKAVFIARFIALFPPVAANLLAGISIMRWRIFLFYNFTGSVVYAISYTLIGYFFGKKWKILEAWLGPLMLYLILTGIILIVLSVIFRDSLSKILDQFYPKKR